MSEFVYTHMCGLGCVMLVTVGDQTEVCLQGRHEWVQRATDLFRRFGCYDGDLTGIDTSALATDGIPAQERTDEDHP